MLIRVILFVLVLASLAFGQSTRHRQGKKVRAGHSHSSSKTTSSELAQLTQNLRASGTTVMLTREKVSQPFFSVRGRIIKINGEAVQVFEYATPSAADSDSSRVSADGTTIGTSKPTWMAPPHFFRSGKLIVLYVGANQPTMDFLRTTLGNQFAGG